MIVPANRAASGVLADYRAAIEGSDRAIRAAGRPRRLSRGYAELLAHLGA